MSQDSLNNDVLLEEFSRYNALLDKRDVEQELPRSQPFALRGSWEVRERYSIEDGVLIGRGEVQSLYYPASRPEILQDFQRLREKPDGTDDETAILAFARRWGTLGYSELRAESADEPTHEEYGLFRPTSDPIHWFMCHTLSVRWASLLLRIVREELSVDRPNPQDYVPNPLVFAARDRLLEWDYAKDSLVIHGDTRNTLLSIAGRFIRRNVSGIRVDPNVKFESKKLDSELAFTSLIEVIWWHVLHLGESPIIKVCPECDSVFPATRANQVYCPIPSYSSGTVSPCSARMRMRAHRKNIKENG